MTKFKEFKKTVATVLAAAMVFSPITSSVAFAADTTVDPAKGSVSSSGTTEGYVVQEAFSVVLPTVASSTLKFTLDPQGLLKVSGNDTKYATVSAGDVVFVNKKSANGVPYGDFSKSNVIYATNKSSYDVTFGVDVTMTNGTSTNQVTFVSSADLVTSGNDLNIYMAAVPEKNYISYADVSGNSFVAVASTPSSVSFALDETGAASLAYKIPGVSSNYTISKNNASYNYVQKANATGWQSVGFTLTGKCNPNADWKAFNDANTQLTLNLAWTLSKASGSEENYVSSNNPAGLIKGIASGYTYVKGTALSITVTPTDSSATISDVAYKMNPSGSWVGFIKGTDYTVAGNTITFPANSGDLYNSASSTPLEVILGVEFSSGQIIESTLTITQP